MDVLYKNDVYTESLKNVLNNISPAVGKISRGLKDYKYLKDDWNSKNKKIWQKEKQDNVSYDKYMEIKNIYKVCKETDNYSLYKKSFKRLAKLLGIPDNNCVIAKISFEDKTNTVICKYSADTKKITIPSGNQLFHKTVHKIANNSLNPTFRSSVYGYLYSSKRVYFSIRNNMGNIFADIRPGKKTLLYTPKETIRSAFIDPLLSSYSVGAVFIETDHPIAVTLVDKTNKKDQEKNIKESVSNDKITLNEATFLLDCLK